MPKLNNNNKKPHDVIKSGSMTKRSQNKKRFTPVNYKNRWFELTKNLLSYFDIENVEVSFFFIFFIYYLLSPVYVHVNIPSLMHMRVLFIREFICLIFGRRGLKQGD